MHYFATLLVRYENAVIAVASHSLEFAAQNAMRYPQHCSGRRQMLLPLLGGDAPRLG